MKSVKTVYFSFPSHIEEEYNRITNSTDFRKVLSNIHLLAESGISIAANVIVTRQTLSEMNATVMFLKENYNLSIVDVTPICAPRYYKKEDIDKYLLSSEDYDVYFNKIRQLIHNSGIQIGTSLSLPFCSLPPDIRDNHHFRKNCGAGISTFTLEMNGNIRACSHSYIIEGNIFSDNFNLKKTLSSWSDLLYLPNLCRDCVETLTCRGGCRLAALTTGGKIDSFHPLAVGKLTERSNAHHIISDKTCDLCAACACCDCFFFTPDNIAIIVSLIGSSIGIGTTTIKALKLWVEDRKSKKIRIKYKDFELEIQGGVSEKDIEKSLSFFNKINADIKESDVTISIVDK